MFATYKSDWLEMVNIAFVFSYSQDIFQTIMSKLCHFLVVTAKWQPVVNDQSIHTIFNQDYVHAW